MERDPLIRDCLIGCERGLRYRLVDRIGEGGNAFVARYIELDSGEIVAIKVRGRHAWGTVSTLI